MMWLGLLVVMPYSQVPTISPSLNVSRSCKVFFLAVDLAQKTAEDFASCALLRVIAMSFNISIVKSL